MARILDILEEFLKEIEKRIRWTFLNVRLRYKVIFRDNDHCGLGFMEIDLVEKNKKL